ncbi:MAG: phosphoglycerate dehydrogenase, partial [Lachnospiraceae bacterium]|nr:phosphoglycerate dehydrogenase [Lachnospiraceae bacterium]
ASMHEMEFSDELLAVARAGAGVNNIPLDACADKGIVVFNTPGANANGVKELVVAGLMLASRDLAGGMKWVEANKDDANINKTMEKAKKAFAGKEAMGKKLGVIGLGAIGVLVANAGHALGMEVMGCDPYLTVEHALELSSDVKLVKSNEEIFRECDYITVHVPLMDATRGMINKDSMAMMKDGVIILNYARDLLVNDDDMAEALQNGKVAKYVTDFPNSKTANMEGVIAFPHLGASTEESEDNCAKMAVKEIVNYLENGNIRNSVNYPNCDAGVCMSEGRITICHKNVPNMIAGFTAILSEDGINIENMINKSRGQYAYTVFDVAGKVSDTAFEKLQNMSEVLKVRKVK